MTNVPRQRGPGDEPEGGPENDPQTDPKAEDATAVGRVALLGAVDPIVRQIVRGVRDRGLISLSFMVQAVKANSGGGIIVLFPTPGRNRFEVEFFSEGLTGIVVRRISS